MRKSEDTRKECTKKSKDLERGKGVRKRGHSRKMMHRKNVSMNKK